jgi:acyl carrier protein
MEQKLKKVLGDVLGMKVADIDESLMMENSDEWDSLKHIELISEIEEVFGVNLEIEEMIAMTSYSDILHILQTR